MKIKLLSNNVLLKPVETENKSGSFYLPDTAAKDKKRMAEVIAVGAGRTDSSGKKIEMTVKVGDKVMYKFSEYSSDEVEMNNEKYVLVSEDDILMVIE